MSTETHTPRYAVDASPEEIAAADNHHQALVDQLSDIDDAEARYQVALSAVLRFANLSEMDLRDSPIVPGPTMLFKRPQQVRSQSAEVVPSMAEACLALGTLAIEDQSNTAQSAA